MNRDKALEVIAASGIDGELATISVENPQAFVLTVPRYTLPEACSSIREQWKTAFSNSAECRDVPLVILYEGTTLQVVDMKDQSRAGCRDHLGE